MSPDQSDRVTRSFFSSSTIWNEWYQKNWFSTSTNPVIIIKKKKTLVDSHLIINFALAICRSSPRRRQRQRQLTARRRRSPPSRRTPARQLRRLRRRAARSRHPPRPPPPLPPALPPARQTPRKPKRRKRCVCLWRCPYRAWYLLAPVRGCRSAIDAISSILMGVVDRWFSIVGFDGLRGRMMGGFGASSRIDADIFRIWMSVELIRNGLDIFIYVLFEDALKNHCAHYLRRISWQVD